MVFELKEKNVLVTGGAGFIGSHLVEALVNIGSNVSVLVRNNSRGDVGSIKDFDQEIQEKLNILFGELTDIESVRDAVKNADIVFHLGAEISIPHSYINPRTFVHTNILGTYNILAACKDYKTKKIIVVSSSEVYGTPDVVPIKENHKLKGQSPYSASKIAAEKLAESFHKSYNLPIVIARPFNTYGPRQSNRAIIPSIIAQTLMKSEISVGNLGPKRDLNFVSDTVNGLIKLAESDKSIGEVINIGSGKEISMRELLNKIILITNRDCKVIKDQKKIRPLSSEVMRLCADNSKIKKLTDWEPKISLDEGLTKTIAWISENLNSYNTHKNYL